MFLGGFKHRTVAFHISVHINWIVILLAGSADSENETALLESKTAKETIDIKEVKRVDHILASLQRKVSWKTYPSHVSLLNNYVHIIKITTIFI